MKLIYRATGCYVFSEHCLKSGPKYTIKPCLDNSAQNSNALTTPLPSTTSGIRMVTDFECRVFRFPLWCNVCCQQASRDFFDSCETKCVEYRDVTVLDVILSDFSLGRRFFLHHLKSFVGRHQR